MRAKVGEILRDQRKEIDAAIADLDPDRARAACRAVGWTDDLVAVVLQSNEDAATLRVLIGQACCVFPCAVR